MQITTTPREVLAVTTGSETYEEKLNKVLPLVSQYMGHLSDATLIAVSQTLCKICDETNTGNADSD